jgi:hypothetical protein
VGFHISLSPPYDFLQLPREASRRSLHNGWLSYAKSRCKEDGWKTKIKKLGWPEIGKHVTLWSEGKDGLPNEGQDVIE